ncbi:ribonuclease H-like domain-containing protein [Mycena amicta]|nr:ribonuclease H-like domain-containing protein [Mycena amicta]
MPMPPHSSPTFASATNLHVPRSPDRQLLICTQPILYDAFYIVDLGHAENVLCQIGPGSTVGFDTEYSPAVHSPQAQRIEQLADHHLAAEYERATHILALDTNSYTPSLPGSALRLVQLAYKQNVYVLDMHRIQGKSSLINASLQPTPPVLPAQLQRILCCSDILKVGFGTNSDVPVVWRDLGFDIQSLVDVGVMARIVHPNTAQNLTSMGMADAVRLEFNYKIPKEEQRSHWQAHELTDQQKTYAAADAAFSLASFHQLDQKIAQKRTSGIVIPPSLYKFNSWNGSATRIYLIHGQPVEWNPVKQCPNHWYYRKHFVGYNIQ